MKWAPAVRVLAWRIHDCPDGYEGPCWGPTDADLVEAERWIRENTAYQQGDV